MPSKRSASGIPEATVREPIRPEDLMRYLDGEMPPGERDALEAALRDSTELQRELAIYRAMQSDFRDLSFSPPPGDGSVWGAVNRRLARPLGWILLVGGALISIALGVYLFVVSSVGPFEKVAVGAIALGVLLLFGSVVAERYREWRVDPYRDVQR